MTKTWTAACSAIIGCATAAMMAQTPAPSQSTASNDKKITVTGCLTAAPSASAASPTGTTGTAGTAGTAVYNGNSPVSGRGDGECVKISADECERCTEWPTDDHPAEAPDAQKASGGQTYQLIANPTALQAHVGKKLELTGTLEDLSRAPLAPPNRRGRR